MLAISNKSELAKEIIFAGLLFLPGFYFASETYYLLLPLAVLLFEIKHFSQHFHVLKQSKKLQLSVFFLLGFIVLATINKAMNGLPITCLKDYYASYFLFPVLVATAFFLRKINFGRWFILLVCLEVITCLFEYFSGIRSFFPVEKPPIDFSSNFIYDHRVFGVSVNSSVVSFKLLAALLLLENQAWKKWLKFAVQALLFVGVIITFNRALILTVLFFYFCLSLWGIWKQKKTIKNALIAIAPLLLFLLIFQGFSNLSILTELNKKNPETKKLELVKVQSLVHSKSQQTCLAAYQPEMKQGSQLNQNLFFTKLLIGSTQHINTSGRTLIWANFFQFIEEHPWFGNGSDKLYFREKDPTSGTEKWVHAHNSFLEIVATHGIILTVFLFLILVFLWQKKNFIFLFTLLFFSLFQYGIFWGISILDIIFMVFLLSPVTLWRNESQSAY